MTAHFVVYRNVTLGISVAHAPCYHDQRIPNYVATCEGVDVSLWDGCPPNNVSLLNTTNSVVSARFGDFAAVFGFTNAKPRTRKGYIL